MCQVISQQVTFGCGYFASMLGQSSLIKLSWTLSHDPHIMLMLIVVISVWTRNLTTYCIHALRSIREQKCEVKLVVHVHAV